MGLDNLGSDELPHFIYLILLLTILVSGFIFRSTLKVSDLVKQASLWLLIALAVIIIYSFRYDFYNLKNRIAAELFPSRAIMVGNRQISINIANDGHFYIDLKINYQTVRFMVDTGASDLVLNIKDAKRIGININKLSFSKPYRTANGMIWGAVTHVREIDISGLKFYDAKISVSNADMGVSLLGMDFLRRFKKYEFYQDQLILTY